MSFDKSFWDAHYATPGHTEATPSPHLVEAVDGRPPGRALDAGCGEGADARWLASQGWEVTAVDIAEAAVARARTPGVSWAVRDLVTWQPPAAFELVTSHYVHLPGPMTELVRRLAAAVRPGGLLLVVGHDPEHGGHAHGSHLDLEAAAAVLDDRWTVLTRDRRPRAFDSGRTVHDVVLTATLNA